MPYTITPTHLPEVLIVQPKVFGDARGFFYESFNARDFESATGLKVEFVQDNHSLSSQGVLRGLHYQIQHAQGKLVRVVTGEVFDIAVDMRKKLSHLWPMGRLSFECRKRDSTLGAAWFCAWLLGSQQDS